MYTLGKPRFPSFLVLRCLQVMWGPVNTGLAQALLAQVCFTHSLCLLYLCVEFSCLWLSERVSPEGQVFLIYFPSHLFLLLFPKENGLFATLVLHPHFRTLWRL